MPSMLPYYENPKHAEFARLFMKEESLVRVPLGYTSFLYDSRPGNERSAKKTGNLVFYNGGLTLFYSLHGQRRMADG